MDQFLVKARYFDAGLSLIDYLRISLPPHPQPSEWEARGGENSAGEWSAEEEGLPAAHQWQQLRCQNGTIQNMLKVNLSINNDLISEGSIFDPQAGEHWGSISAHVQLVLLQLSLRQREEGKSIMSNPVYEWVENKIFRFPEFHPPALYCALELLGVSSIVWENHDLLSRLVRRNLDSAVSVEQALSVSWQKLGIKEVGNEVAICRNDISVEPVMTTINVTKTRCRSWVDCKYHNILLINKYNKMICSLSVLCDIGLGDDDNWLVWLVGGGGGVTGGEGGRDLVEERSWSWWWYLGLTPAYLISPDQRSGVKWFVERLHHSAVWLI